MTAASLVRDLTAFSVQITVVALAIALLLKVVRIPATARYLGLRLALVASLTVPWLLRAPEVQAPVRVPGVIQVATDTPPSAVTASAVPAAQASEPVKSTPIPWMRLGLGALLMGALARIVWLAVGVRRLLKLKQQGVIVDEPEYSQLQEQLGTSAAITQVERLSQPATFGVRRPVVLLPDTLAAAPASLRCAVVTHELFHVRRRDWLGLVAEEMVRTALWFHPAVLWLTSQIQLAREEIVDELTVRATGDRRTYVEALLAFADTPGLSPAPAFAHRRQLFHRILSVSKEKAMSTPRIASSVAALVLAVAGASWYASALFPIVKAAREDVQAPTARADRAEVSVRDSKVVLSGNVELVSDGTTVRASKMVLELGPQTPNAAAPRPVTPENPIPRRTRGVSPTWPQQFSGRQIQVVVSALVAVDRDGRVTAVSRDGCSVTGDGEDVCGAFFDVTAAAIRQWQYDRPSQGPIHFYVTVTYRPGIEPTVTQSAESRATYTSDTMRNRLRAERDLETSASFLRAQTDSMRARLEELINKAREVERAQRLAIGRSGAPNSDLAQLQQQLARMNDEISLTARQLLDSRIEELRDVDRLRDAVEQLRAGEAQVRALQAEAASRAAQAPNARRLVAPSGRTPISIAEVPGLKAPTVTKRVRPEHPVAAMQARVEGAVVVEALVDEQGASPTRA